MHVPDERPGGGAPQGRAHEGSRLPARRFALCGWITCVATAWIAAAGPASAADAPPPPPVGKPLPPKGTATTPSGATGAAATGTTGANATGATGATATETTTTKELTTAKGASDPAVEPPPSAPFALVPETIPL